MIDTDGVWDLCMVRDAIRHLRPGLYHDICRLSITDATPIIEKTLGLELKNRDLRSACAAIMVALYPDDAAQ